MGGGIFVLQKQNTGEYRKAYYLIYSELYLTANINARNRLILCTFSLARRLMCIFYLVLFSYWYFLVLEVFKKSQVFSVNRKSLPNIGQIRQKWPSGGLNLQNQKIRMYVHKTQLFSVITYPLTIKINPDNTVYANVSDIPAPLMTARINFYQDAFEINNEFQIKSLRVTSSVNYIPVYFIHKEWSHLSWGITSLIHNETHQTISILYSCSTLTQTSMITSQNYRPILTSQQTISSSISSYYLQLTYSSRSRHHDKSSFFLS